MISFFYYSLKVDHRKALVRHTRKIRTLCLSSDGAVLLSGGDFHLNFSYGIITTFSSSGEDGLLVVWDLGSNTHQTISSSNGFVLAATWMPSTQSPTKAFAFGCHDGMIHVHVRGDDVRYSTPQSAWSSKSAFRGFSISLHPFTWMMGRLNFSLSIQFPPTYLHWPLEVAVPRLGVLMRHVSNTWEKHGQLLTWWKQAFSSLLMENVPSKEGYPRKVNSNNHLLHCQFTNFQHSAMKLEVVRNLSISNI